MRAGSSSLVAALAALAAPAACRDVSPAVDAR